MHLTSRTGQLASFTALCRAWSELALELATTDSTQVAREERPHPGSHPRSCRLNCPLAVSSAGQVGLRNTAKPRPQWHLVVGADVLREHLRNGQPPPAAPPIDEAEGLSQLTSYCSDLKPRGFQGRHLVVGADVLQGHLRSRDAAGGAPVGGSRKARHLRRHLHLSGARLAVAHAHRTDLVGAYLQAEVIGLSRMLPGEVVIPKSNSNVICFQIV